MAYWEHQKLLAKMLYVGEYGALFVVMCRYFWTDKDINEDVDEAKTLIKQGDAGVDLCSLAP